MEDTPGDIHRLIRTQWIRQFSGFGSSCTEHERCWGNTILQTSYDNDAKFSLAVAAIYRLAMAPIKFDYEERGTGEGRDQPAEDDGPEIDEDFCIRVTSNHAWICQSLQEAYQGMIRHARLGRHARADGLVP